MTKLQEKIEQFIKEERGGGGIAGIWELIDGKKKPESILSDELLQHWKQIQDNTIYTVDVGIACLGNKSKLPDPPKKEDNESLDKYAKRLNRWINKRDITYQEWDTIKFTREDEFEKFIDYYQGTIESTIDGIIPSAANLSDSFTCRIRISGKGLKDLVLNFPYLFEVSEMDEFRELMQSQDTNFDKNTSFILELYLFRVTK